MAESMQSLDQLSQLKPAAPEAPKYVKKLDKQGRAYATGKRKDAVARVWIKPGAGKVMVNARDVEVYFARPVLRMMIQQPLVAAARNGQYDVICTVAGGPQVVPVLEALIAPYTFAANAAFTEPERAHLMRPFCCVILLMTV